MTEVRALSGAHIRALYQLAVAPEQQTFVAPNGITMSQAPFEVGSEVYGLWAGDTAVGLIALIDMAVPGVEVMDFEDTNGLFVWRLMVADGAQRKGHGRAAMQFAIEAARARGRSSISTSAVEGPGSPIPFYQGMGLELTGRYIDEEAELLMTL